MKFLKLPTFITLIFTMLLFSNCKKDGSKTTVAEDKENIESSLDEIITKVRNFKNGCAIETADRFMDFDQGQINSSQWIGDMATAFENHSSLDYFSPDRRFRFDNHKGTHTWDASSNSWSVSNTSSNKIVIKVPAQKSSTTNGLTCTIENYTDQSTTISGTQYYFPKTVKVNLKSGAQTCMSLDLKSVTYDNGSFGIPLSAEAEVNLSPFNFEVKANKVTPTEFSYELNVTNSGAAVFSLLGNVIIKHSNYETLHFFDDIKTVAGEFIVGDFTYVYSGDIEGYQALLAPTEAQINSLFDVEVQYRGAKMGDLDYRDNNGKFEVIINYKDGTTENSDTYYNEFLDNLEREVVGYTGAWNWR